MNQDRFFIVCIYFHLLTNTQTNTLNRKHPCFHVSIVKVTLKEVNHTWSIVHDLTDLMKYCTWFDWIDEVLYMIWLIWWSIVHDLTDFMKYWTWFDWFHEVLNMIWLIWWSIVHDLTDLMKYCTWFDWIDCSFICYKSHVLTDQKHYSHAPILYLVSIHYRKNKTAYP